MLLLLLGEEVGPGQQGLQMLEEKFLGGQVRLGDEVRVALFGVDFGVGEGAHHRSVLPQDGFRRLGQLLQVHVLLLSKRPPAPVTAGEIS